jgi:hypothetical protein
LVGPFFGLRFGGAALWAAALQWVGGLSLLHYGRMRRAGGVTFYGRVTYSWFMADGEDVKLLTLNLGLGGNRGLVTLPVS